MTRPSFLFTLSLSLFVAPPSIALGGQPWPEATMEAFVDSLFAAKMQEQDIPGAVFVLVREGEPPWMRGYGYADVEQQLPVDPARTGFRVASLTKLFTTTAVLQLVEQGKVSLDEDLTPLLAGVGVRKNYPAPITLMHLLTHTSGLDRSDIGDATWDPSAIQSPEAYLRSQRVYQSFPPGRLWRYSNYNMVLVGYLIAQRSGLPYSTYMEEAVLKPLAMHHSSFAQPLPDALQQNLAIAYEASGEGWVEVPQDYSNVVPAGGLTSTGLDIARFLTAQLQDGRYEGRRILEASSVHTMQAQHFTYHRRLAGHALGFREEHVGTSRRSEGAQRALSHSGARPGFSSELVLLPAAGVGLFVATNRRNGSFRYAIIDALLSRFYPGHDVPPPRSLPSPSPPGEWTGRYRSVEHPFGTLEKFGAFIVKRFYATVSQKEPGILQIEDGPDLIEIEPGLYQTISGTQLVGFGRLSETPYFFTRNQAFIKLAWYERRGLHWAVLIFYNMMFLSACIGWPLAHRWKKSTSLLDKDVRRARWYAGVVSGLGLAFFWGLVVITETTPNGELFDYGIPLSIKLNLALPVFCTLLTPALLYYTLRLWRKGHGGWMTRVHYSAVTVAVLLFIFWTYHWRLLGFQY